MSDFKFKVNIMEYEKGWGHKLDRVEEFDTIDQAEIFIRDHNAKNNEPKTPDLYWVAERANYTPDPDYVIPELNCREYTEDEVRDMFMGHIRMLINYWDKETRKPTRREALEGFAHSFLVLLDGGSALPGFIVAPRPHADDKKFHQENGENWFPENHESNVKCDIGGYLHELLYVKQETNEPTLDLSKYAGTYSLEEAQAMIENMKKDIEDFKNQNLASAGPKK